MYVVMQWSKPPPPPRYQLSWPYCLTGLKDGFNASSNGVWFVSESSIRDKQMNFSTYHIQIGNLFCFACRWEGRSFIVLFSENTTISPGEF